MAWIRVRESAQGLTYSVQWRENGRIQSVTYASDELPVAEAFRDEVNAHSNRWPPGRREQHYGLTRNVRTVRGQILHYVETHSDGEKGWRGESRRMVDRYFPATDALAALPVTQVTHSDVRAWVQRMKNRPLKPKTIRNAHALLSSALNLAMLDGDITANPAVGAAPSSNDYVPGPALTQQEFATIVSLMPEAYRLLVLALGRTGMRWGEITALTWGNVHLTADTPYIYVAQAWKETEKRGQYEIGTPKSRRGIRRIYIDTELADALRSHRPRGAKRTDYVFLTEYENPIRANNFHYRHWRPKVVAAYEEGLLSFTPRIHDLRHAHATWLLEDGQPVARVAARLGHDPAVLMRTYSHLMDRGAAETADAVGAMFANVVPLPLPEGFEFETPSQRRGRRAHAPSQEE